jgi:hypothetical protein
MIGGWLKTLVQEVLKPFGKGKSNGRPVYACKVPNSFRPLLEKLEDRLTPASILFLYKADINKTFPTLTFTNSADTTGFVTFERNSTKEYAFTRVNNQITVPSGGIYGGKNLIGYLLPGSNNIGALLWNNGEWWCLSNGETLTYFFQGNQSKPATVRFSPYAITFINERIPPNTSNLSNSNNSWFAFGNLRVTFSENRIDFSNKTFWSIPPNLLGATQGKQPVKTSALTGNSSLFQRERQDFAELSPFLRHG